MKKFIAFTLAEVLITLTIIGVIAAITIPNLMQKWQKEATVTKVKKGYNAITRMATNIKTNTNCNDLACTGLLDISDDTEQLKKFIELAGLKDAKIETNTMGRVMYLYCEKQACNGTEGSVLSKYIVTQDGMGYNVWKATRTEPATNFLGVMLFTDVKPTGVGHFKRGRNAFYFFITDDLRAEPAVWNASAAPWTLSEASKKVSRYINLSAVNSSCSVNDTSVVSGCNCAAKIILDGWKMNY